MKGLCTIGFIHSFEKRTYLLYPIWFQTKHSTSHSLIHLAELIRKQLDDANYGCGIFVDFQKADKTVDLKILLKKLEHYDIRGTSSKWFASYLTNRNQYVSINRFNLDLADTICGVPQGFILSPLLFLVYIHVLHFAIEYVKVYHFADDTNLMNLQAL